MELAHLVETYQHHVLAVALATVLDSALAEDIAQETFLIAHARAGQIRDPSAVGRWLAAIARNLGRDQLRARRRELPLERAPVPVDDGALDADLDSARLRAHVQRALARVPSHYREVLVAYYGAGRPADQIARDLGLTVAATLQRLARGRRLLRRHGGALRELLGSARARPGFALAMLALLGTRRAHAAPARRVPAQIAFAASIVAIAGIGDARSRVAPAEVVAARTVLRAVAPPSSRRSEPAVHLAPTSAPVRRVAPAPRAAGGPPVVTTRRFSIADAWPHPPFMALALAGDEPEVSPAPPPAAPVRFVADPTVATLHTAALPRTGQVDFEEVMLAMFVRVGVTDHVAMHAGMIGLDERDGSGAVGLGGGISVGGRLSPHVAVAAVAEGAREVEKSLQLGEAWIARGYATVTGWRERNSTSLAAGVIARDDGERATVPFVGVASQLGWDEGLAFVLEAQWFLRRLGTTRSTSVSAVRFELRDPARRVLGIARGHIDIGFGLLDRSDDIAMIPWVGVGLGW